MKNHARSLVKVLAEVIGRSNVRHGIEVGVWRGELSRDLLRNFVNLELLMVDLWAPTAANSTMMRETSCEEMEQAHEEASRTAAAFPGRGTIYRGDSTLLAPALGDGFDFVFIDADHMYERVKQDIEVYHHKVRIGGVLAGHDYNGWGDQKKGWGVKRAVDEFARDNGYQVTRCLGNVWWVKKR